MNAPFPLSDRLAFYALLGFIIVYGAFMLTTAAIIIEKLSRVIP